MNKIEKSITIRYSKAGYNQYATFGVVEDKVTSKSFYPSYVNIDDVPSLDGADTIEDILKIIRDFSYNNDADIYSINGEMPEYFNNTTVKESITKYSDLLRNAIEDTFLKFFNENILPIINKNNWKLAHSWCGKPVLVEKDENEGWNNIKDNKDSTLIDFICSDFLSESMSINLDVRSHCEHSDEMSVNGLVHFIGYIPNIKLVEIGVLIIVE